MAGLLDAFGDENARFSLGLLAAAAPRFDGANDGQRIMEALQGVDSWKQKQAQAKMQQMQMDEYNQKLAQQKAAQEAAARKQAALPSILGGAPALAPLMGDADSGILPSAGRPAGPTTIDVRAALAAGYTPEEIQALDKLRTVGLDEVARTVDVEGPGGSKNVQGFDRFGRPVGQGIAGYVAPVSVNQGDRTTFVKPTAGISLPMGMSPGDRDASARGWANVGIARERLGMDKSKAAAEAANGGYSAKPLPAAALKMQSDAVDAIGTAAGINDQLTKVASQIETGKLSFGPVSNAIGGVRNAMGMSNEQSRNLSSFRSTMEKLRNDSLRLNAGVQTDGDAQRAWNELFQNINDTDLVKQRLKEITAINKRAEELQRLKVDQIRGNYNAPPLDLGPISKPMLNVPKSNRLKFDAQGNLVQ